MKDSVLLYAAGALDPAEADEVRRHLAGGCPSCAGLLAEAEATVALLAFSLRPQSPSPELKEKLMGRLGAPASRPAATTAAAPATEAMPWWALIFIPSAIAAVVAAGLAIVFAMRMQAAQPATDQTALTEKEQTIGVLTAKIEQDAQELSALRSGGIAQTAAWAAQPDLKFLWLDGTAKQPAGSGARIFWDCKSNVWHFFASGVKPAAAGKTYELWFVSSDGKTALPAGEFDPNSSGDASLVTNVPAAMQPNQTIAAVTDEPAGQTITAPSGSFQLVAKAPAR